MKELSEEEFVSAMRKRGIRKLEISSDDEAFIETRAQSQTGG